MMSSSDWFRNIAINRKSVETRIAIVLLCLCNKSVKYGNLQWRP